MEEYLQLKIKLSQKEWNSGSEYADVKSAFIRKIEQAAANKQHKN